MLSVFAIPVCHVQVYDKGQIGLGCVDEATAPVVLTLATITAMQSVGFDVGGAPGRW